MLKQEIGKTAGEIWKYLGKNGKLSLTDLSAKTKIKSDLAHQAIGWLAREEKVQFIKEGKGINVVLTAHELNNYRRTESKTCC
jgi:hypothetical protein